jgi:hypothetical protein
VAIEAVYAALKKLEPADRKKILSSAFALLGEDSNGVITQAMPAPAGAVASTSLTGRPLSLGEFMQEKRPASNDQRIAAFAYYREKYEGLSRFSRGDLESYFGKAKLSPAGNYDRDFGKAVSKAWIHEDGADSYLTTKGVEAVENGFDGASAVVKKRKTSARKKRR